MSHTPRALLASPPGPEPEARRLAYLDLLKLALCDLAGPGTHEVTADGAKRAFSRELTPEQWSWRVEGRDWPLNGLTMVGLNRLDDLQRCVESVVRDGIPGDLIEAGAWRGGASIFIRATLDSLGAHERTLWVADSFQGFPAPEESDVAADRMLETHMSEIAFPAPSHATVARYFARYGVERGVSLLPGFFEDTMPALRGHRWSLLRLDADTYKATKVLLEALYPGLARGGYVILDDYFHPFLSDACRRAADDFRAEHGIEEPIEQIDYTGARWRRTTEPDPLPARGAGPEAVTVAPAAASQEPAPRIPTDHELGLADQLERARAELADAERRLAWLRSSRRLRAWRRSG